ncbi:MAG: ankyrin repeat domain-containing protein [Armatimonadota bacterium]
MRRGILLSLVLIAVLIGVRGCYLGQRQHAADEKLFSAVMRNDIPALRRALSRGASPNARYDHPWPMHNYSYSALSEAVRLGHLEAAAELLRRGASPQSTGRWAQPVLSIARRRKNPEMIRLLRKHGARP